MEWRSRVEREAPKLGRGITETVEALKVLTACPIPEAGAAVVPYLTDTTYGGLACDVLGRSGLAVGRGHLEPLLASPDEQLQWKAASGLGLLGDRAAIPTLKSVFTQADRPFLLRWAAIALGELGGAPERAFLEAQSKRHTGFFPNQGIQIGLQLLGAGAETTLSSMEPDLDTLLDHYCDPARGLEARAALLTAPEDAMDDVIARLTEGPVGRRFAAADLLGVRAIERAKDGLQALFDESVPELSLVSATSLMRLGGDDIAEPLRKRWFSFAPPVREVEARRAVLMDLPVPDAVVRILLDDLCAFVIPAAAEFLRRDPTPERRALLTEALTLEYARVEGSAEPRGRRDNDMDVMNRKNIHRLIVAGRLRLTVLPQALRTPAEGLQRAGFRNPNVLAAHSLLLALTAYTDVKEHLQPWLTSRAAVLRLRGLMHWSGVSQAPPDGSMENDPDPTVRALWVTLS